MTEEGGVHAYFQSFFTKCVDEIIGNYINSSLHFNEMGFIVQNVFLEQ